LEKVIMHLALICDDYYPDSTRVSAKMMHELACDFQQNGHEVSVFCPSNNNLKTIECLCIDGVRVYKFPNGPVKNVSKIRRAINESMLSINAWRHLSGIIKGNAIDGVVYYSPSIFFGLIVKKIKKIWNCNSYLILRDSFPQWLVDQNIIRKGGMAERYFKLFEKINYQSADSIGVMSQKNHEIFVENFKHFKDKAEVLYNWASISNIDNIEQSNLRSELGLENKIIFFYGGNIGHAQDMANIMRLVKGMKDYDNVHFLLIGQGDEVSLVQQYIFEHALKNCTYLPSISQEEYKAVLKCVDIGLFSLARNHSIHNFPGKLLGYMANKLPILGSVNEGNDLKDVVSQAGAGFIYTNGEDDQLLHAAIELATSSQLREAVGKKSLSLLNEKFTVMSASSKILQSLNS